MAKRLPGQTQANQPAPVLKPVPVKKAYAFGRIHKIAGQEYAWIPDPKRPGINVRSEALVGHPSRDWAVAVMPDGPVFIINRKTGEFNNLAELHATVKNAVIALGEINLTLPAMAQVDPFCYRQGLL